MRALGRAAAFGLMTPPLAALSIAFCNDGSIASASFALFALINREMDLIASFIAFFLRALKATRFSAARAAFFADFVRAMSRDTTPMNRGRQVFCSLFTVN